MDGEVGILPRGKSRKDKTAQIVESKKQVLTDKELENFAQSFVKASQNMMGTLFYNPLVLSPFLQNQIIKDLNSNPYRFSREQIERMLSNPKNAEEALRELSEYLYYKIMHYKRVVNYFGGMLDFDWDIVPINATSGDMNTSAFKRSAMKAYEFVEKVNPKYAFNEIMQKTMLDGAGYYYMREHSDHVVFQQMPSDWAMIVGNTQVGYRYSFNLMYFLQMGVNIYEYAPEFLEYFEDYKVSAEYGYPFWKPLDPTVAPVFKTDPYTATIIPPFAGSFVDANQIDTYKELFRNQAEIQTTKLLAAKLPLHKENNGVLNKDNFAIDAVTAGKFNALIQSALPQMIRSVISPFDVEVLDFSKDTQNKDNIVGVGEEAFYKSSGTSSDWFGGNPSTASAVRAAQRVDEYFVKSMYGQFERFVNYQLQQRTGKFKFRVEFCGTMWDRQERIETASKFAQFGGPVSKWALAAYGMNMKDFISITNFENAMGIKDIMKPVVSSHTQNMNEGGAPKKSQVGDDGEHSRDNEVNSTY